jgi:hypothetical protein
MTGEEAEAAGVVSVLVLVLVLFLCQPFQLLLPLINLMNVRI